MKIICNDFSFSCCYYKCKTTGSQCFFESEEKIMNNIELRKYASRNNVKLWQISEALGYPHESRFSRELRHELTEEKKQKIIQIIDKLAEKRTVVK